MSSLNILIIGNSISGPALASFLLLHPSLSATAKPHITLLERASSARKQGQNIDIRGTGIELVKLLGLESIIKANTTGEEGVQLVDDKNTIWMQRAAGKEGEAGAPTAEIEIMRGKLAEILEKRSRWVSEKVKRAGGKGIAYVFGDYLDEIEQDGEQVRVRFKKSGERRSYDIVVAADGLQSGTRRMVWGEKGEEDRVKRLGAYGAFYSIPKGETDTMWRRWYHAPGRRGIMVRPNKGAGNTTVFMTVLPEDERKFVEVARREVGGADAQKRVMAEQFEDAGWETSRVLQGMMETNDFYYDMIAQVKMESWHKGRVVLLGDAGYCGSPLSGMGTTLGLNGAYSLAAALMQHPDDLETAFSQYEDRMRPLVTKAQKLAPGMPRLIHPETAWGIWFMHMLSWLIASSGIFQLLGKFVGPPANAFPVEDYGFQRLEDWKVQDYKRFHQE